MSVLRDSGSQASFITKAKAKAFSLPIVKVQSPIAGVGSAKTQKTIVLMVIKINDEVETNLHVIARITNEILTQPIDVQQLRHVNILQLADPKFNVPGRINALLGVDVF